MDDSVTVVVPVNNREALVGEAVDSALAQSAPVSEVIVVDDGSTDGTAEILRGYGDKIRVISQERKGRSTARNVGIEAANGSLIAFLDSDDRWHPDKIARQLELLQTGGPALITGYNSAVDDGGEEVADATQSMRERLDQTRAQSFTFSSLVLQPAVYTSSWLVPKHLLEQAGMFDEALDALEDWDLLLRLRRTTPIHCVEWPPVVDYRIHAGNTQSSAMARGAVKVIAKHLTDPTMTNKGKAALHLVRARNLRSLLDQSGARSACKNALQEDAGLLLKWKWWRLLAGALLPTSVVSRARSHRTSRSKNEAL